MISISFSRAGLLRGHKRRQRASQLLRLCKASLIDEAALLNDQDSVETGGEAGAAQAAKQAAANELVFQALKNGGLRFTVEDRSGIAKSDKIGPF